MSLIGFWNKMFKRDARDFVGMYPQEAKEQFIIAQAGRGAMKALVDRDVVSYKRAHHLRSEIDRLRRNKKKVSHLVAELAELENGK